MGTITTTFVKRINNVIEYKGTLTAIFKVGERGPQGEPGPGVAIGGTTGQVLTKASDSDYDTAWSDTTTGVDEVLLSSSIMDLTSDSTQEEIITAVGGLVKFKSDVGKLSNNATCKITDPMGYYNIPTIVAYSSNNRWAYGFINTLNHIKQTLLITYASDSFSVMNEYNEELVTTISSSSVDSTYPSSKCVYDSIQSSKNVVFDSAILQLTSSSSQEDIIAAFGSAYSFSSKCKLIRDGAQVNIYSYQNLFSAGVSFIPAYVFSADNNSNLSSLQLVIIYNDNDDENLKQVIFGATYQNNTFTITNTSSNIIPSGGTTGQVLSKTSDTDFDTQWVNVSSGGTDDHNLLANRFSDNLTHTGYQHDIAVIAGLETALSVLTTNVNINTSNISTNTNNISALQGYFTNGVADEAAKVSKSLTLKFNTGTTEGTSLYTFNGSAVKTINIKSGNLISFTTESGGLTINHSSITAPTLATNKVINGITIDNYGHTTAITGLSYTTAATASTLGLRGSSGELRNTYLVLSSGQTPSGLESGEIALYIGSGGFDSVSGGSGGTSEFTYITSYIIMLDDNGTTNITEMITAADFLQVCQDLVAGKNLLLRTLDTDLGLNITISPITCQCSVNSDSAILVIYCSTDPKEYALITINLDRTNSTLSYTKETTVLQ